VSVCLLLFLLLLEGSDRCGAITSCTLLCVLLTRFRRYWQTTAGEGGVFVSSTHTPTTCTRVFLQYETNKRINFLSLSRNRLAWNRLDDSPPPPHRAEIFPKYEEKQKRDNKCRQQLVVVVVCVCPTPRWDFSHRLLFTCFLAVIQPRTNWRREREKKSQIFQLNGKRLSSYTRRNKFEFVEVVAAAAKRMRIRDGHGAHLRHIRSCVESERSVPLFLSKFKKEREMIHSFIRSFQLLVSSVAQESSI